MYIIYSRLQYRLTLMRVLLNNSLFTLIFELEVCMYYEQRKAR